MSESLVLYLLILALGCGLAAIAKRIEIPYPIILVPAGVLLSLIPAMPDVPLNADIALRRFLPLLIYAGVVSGSWRDFLADIRAISLLAVGHVIFATVVIAALAHYLIPGFPWPEALLLGAVVAPPDEVAAIQILRRLGIPHRILSVLEGEGMANDATALTLYRIALGAVATHRVIYSDAAVLFGSVVIGEIAWGLAVGWVVTWIRRTVGDASIASVLSVLTPFFRVHSSGRTGRIRRARYRRRGILCGDSQPSALFAANANPRLEHLAVHRFSSQLLAVYPDWSPVAQHYCASARSVL